MRTRREFIAGAVTGLAVMGLERLAFAKQPDHSVGVQLYTVRKLVEADLPGTLKAVREIGYRSVETYAAQYKSSAKELRTAILDQGLTVPSAHFRYEDMEAQFDYAKELGVEYVVCSSVPKKIANSIESYQRAADQYNAWGAQAKKMGMRFGFHNHNAEFRSYDGTTGFDVLMQRTDPALVQWQMDCYWVTQAGYDPVAMLRRYAKRMQSLHLKDRKPGAPTSVEPGPNAAHFTEIGEGTLDWRTILRLARKEHILFMFVEQDTTERPPLESLRISYDNLMKFLS